MRELRRTLKAMGEINTKIANSANGFGASHSSEIVTLRQDFSQSCGEFVNRLQELLSDSDNVPLFVSLQDGYDEMRGILQGHQQQWTPEAIAEDPVLYLQRKAVIAHKITGFIEGSLAEIADEIDTAT